MDRNIDERLRKPRRALGTPFYRVRSYYALVTLAVGGICYYIFEQAPVIRRLKGDIANNAEARFPTPPSLRDHIDASRISIQHPELSHVVERIQAKKQAAVSGITQNEPENQPWYALWYQKFIIEADE